MHLRPAADHTSLSVSGCFPLQISADISLLVECLVPLRRVVLLYSLSQEYLIVRSCSDANAPLAGLLLALVRDSLLGCARDTLLVIHFVVPAADHTGLSQRRTDTQEILFHNHLQHLKFLPHDNYKKLEIVVS